MTPTELPQLTPHGTALRHLAATGALDHLDPTEPSYPQIEDGWLHLDRSCDHLGTDATAPAAAALVAALDTGQLVLCACVYGRSNGPESGALSALADVTTEADRLLAELDAEGAWDLQLARHTQLTAQRDALRALLAGQALPATLDRWATDLTERYDQALARTVAGVRAVVRDQLPQRLAAQSARRAAADARAGTPDGAPDPLPSPAGDERLVSSRALFGQVSAVQRGVMFAYPSVIDGGFYARVPAAPFWAAGGDLIDCGPAQPGDTDAVLAAALRLRAGVTEGPMQNPAEALRVARELAAAGQL